MKNILAAKFGLLLGLSLVVAGWSGTGLQFSSPALAKQNALVNKMSTVLRQAMASYGLPLEARGYTVTDLGTLGGTISNPNDIANNGAITGPSTLAGDTVTRGFLWAGRGLIDLGALPAGADSDGISVNNKLQVVGTADVGSTKHDDNACYCGSADLNSPFVCHSFLWQHGIMTDLGTMGGNSSIGEWINNRGQIVGISQINAIDPNGYAPCGSGPGNQIERAYLFENGRFNDLGTLGGYDASAIINNDRGQIAGGSDVSTMIDPKIGHVPVHAFLWTNGVMKDLGTLGGGFSTALGLNAEGTAAGLSTLRGEQHFHAFLWQNGWQHSGMIDLGVLGGDTDSWAYGINSRDQVVGFSYTSTTMRAYIWQKGVMTDLNMLISPTSGFQLVVGNYINDAGQIAAQALVKNTGELHTVLLTPSNDIVRGKSSRVPLTGSVRRLLLRGYGRAVMMKFLIPNY